MWRYLSLFGPKSNPTASAWAPNLRLFYLERASGLPQVGRWLGLFTFLLLLNFSYAKAQSPEGLRVNSDFTADELVREVFASGSCETISDISAIGNQDGIGFFEAPADLIGFSRGIILSTGPISNALAPNIGGNTGGDLGGFVNDPDLDIVAARDLNDRVGISFDFVPLQEEVSFRYVFASEEFCEFANSDYNDVFGFFVSGPGLNGPYSNDGVNVALLPESGQPVAINTINHLVNSQYYLSNELSQDRQFCGLDPFESPRLDRIEYDGQTVVLTAKLTLIPCERYQIRLVISDVADENYDSAVFLEAGSFDLGGSVSLQALGSDTVNNRIFEGCEQPSFRFLRGTDSDIANDQTINYRFGENSPATPGIDFVMPSGSITIPAGETFADLILETIPDNLDEGSEDIWLYLDIPCACYTDSVRISLVDPEPLVLALEDVYYCPDQIATLQPNVSGGSPPYSYNWSFGSTEANPQLNPPLPTTIGLTVTDACGQTTGGNLPTFSSSPPTANLPNQDVAACWGESRELSVELVGRPPFSLTYQRSGNTPQTITFEEDGLQSWTIEQGGQYQLTAVRDQACNGTVSGSVPANFYRPVINPVITNPTCANEQNGSISITHLSSVPPYQYSWSGDTDATGTLADNLSRGQYGLTITDALGCRDERQFELRGPSPLLPVAVDCNQLRRPPLDLNADGGQPPYMYSINGIDFFESVGFRDLEAGFYYDLFIRDANGCEVLQPDFFLPASVPRTVALPNFIPQELGGSVVIEPEYLVPFDQIDSIAWLPADFFSCADCPVTRLSAPQSGSISMVVTDRYGCVDSLSVLVGIDEQAPLFVPTAFSPDEDGLNDRLSVFANRLQVEQILSFQVYTRWGNLVYEDYDFQPNSTRRGWNGRFNGRFMPPATYVWVARIRLTTGLEVTTGGSTNLLR
ncbi:MAG: choice-of-anchor L domain-containing protein [Bacteroidota bacterium]